MKWSFWWWPICSCLPGMVNTTAKVHVPYPYFNFQIQYYFTHHVSFCCNNFSHTYHNSSDYHVIHCCTTYHISCYKPSTGHID